MGRKTRMRRWGVAGALFGLGLVWLASEGCGEPLGCKYFCQREAVCCSAQYGCDPDKVDIPACTATCEDLSKDETYKAAIEDQASCYEGSSCDEINNGSCTAQP
jgi:hypothetical protein